MIRRMHGDPVVAPVAKALQDALARLDDVEAVAIVARIAERHAALRRLPDRVMLADFGAASGEASGGENPQPAKRIVELGSFYRLSRVDPLSSRILFHLVRELRPDACVELGTCTGLSAAYQAAALKLNGSGRIITIEGDEELARRAADSLRALGLDRATVRNGHFDAELPPACAELSSVDFVFNDGHHEEEPTIRYFETMLPYLAPEATLVLDDINWSAGMRRAWRALSEHPRVEASVDLYRLGILRLGGSASAPKLKRHYRPLRGARRSTLDS